MEAKLEAVFWVDAFESLPLRREARETRVGWWRKSLLSPS